MNLSTVEKYKHKIDLFKNLIKEGKIKIDPENGIIRYIVIYSPVVIKYDLKSKHDAIISYPDEKKIRRYISAKSLVWLYVYGDLPYDCSVTAINKCQRDFRVQNLKLKKKHNFIEINENKMDVSDDVENLKEIENIDNEIENIDNENDLDCKNEKIDFDETENTSDHDYDKEINTIAKEISNMCRKYNMNKKNIIFDILLEI